LEEKDLYLTARITIVKKKIADGKNSDSNNISKKSHIL